MEPCVPTSSVSVSVCVIKPQQERDVQRVSEEWRRIFLLSNFSCLTLEFYRSVYKWHSLFFHPCKYPNTGLIWYRQCVEEQLIDGDQAEGCAECGWGDCAPGSWGRMFFSFRAVKGQSLISCSINSSFLPIYSVTPFVPAFVHFPSFWKYLFIYLYELCNGSFVRNSVFQPWDQEFKWAHLIILFKLWLKIPHAVLNSFIVHLHFLNQAQIDAVNVWAGTLIDGCQNLWSQHGVTSEKRLGST